MAKKKKNKVLQVFYYILAFVLAAFALGPLVWMVDTSFKTNSEVLSYPPRWGTINAMPYRKLSGVIEKVRTAQNVSLSTISLSSLFSQTSSTSKISGLASPNTLVIKVLGAAGYRGTGTMPRRGRLIITLTNKKGGFAKYATKMSASIFERVISRNDTLSLPSLISQRIKSLDKYKARPMEYILKFYNDFLYSSNAVFNRINFLNGISTLPLGKESLSELMKYKHGVGPLSVKELTAIKDILNKASKTFSSKKAVEEAQEYENTINVFENLNAFFKKSMNKQLNGSIEVEFVPNSNKMKIVKAPSIVESVYQNGDEIDVKFKRISFVWFVNDSVKIEAHYNFWQVLTNLFQNYVSAWNSAPFGRYYINSIFVASSTTVLNIIFDAMMAFAFSKLVFPGRNKLFMMVIATMMIPYQVLLVANYLTIHNIGWLNTYYALIVPWSASAFVVFLMRQAFNSIPQDFYDAAKIDGASSWRFLWSIAVPISRPVIITGALLTFVGSWNAFLWVLIMTDTANMRTIPVGLQNFTINSGTIFNQLMAAATFSMLPIVIAFMFLQKYFVGGLFRSGIK